MTKRVYIIIFMLLTSVSSLVAQEKLIEKANEKYSEYSFSPAIDIYKKVLDKGYVTQNLLEKLGNSYYFNADYKSASETYERLVNEFGNDVGPEYYFRYAQSLKSLKKYDKASEMMAKFSESKSDNLIASEFKTKRDYLKEIKNNSGKFGVSPFAYNSKYSDFAPSYYKSGLIFSSDRDTGNFARYRHTWNSRDFLDLYKVNADSSSNNKATKFGNKEVNTKLHESTSTATKDGNTVYFTRNNYKEGKYVKDDKGVIRLKIFRASFTEEGWTNIEELPFNSDNYSVAHPTLSPDEKTLYFASDMPGTFGESDIFKIKINDDGTFGKPVNLGEKINTEARETFPFVSSENTLYFSSDGHPGLGGLDVFASKIAYGKIAGAIVNAGEPVNSNMDDFTFIFDDSTKTGYFASNREKGLGSDDIYAVVENEPLDLECKQLIIGTVRDKISNEILVGANIKVIDEANEEISTTIMDSTGEYQLTIDCNKGNFVRAVVDGYVPSEEYLGQSDGKPRIIDFYLERETVTAGLGDDLSKLLQLSTIYFDLNKYDIRPDAELEIQKVIAAMEKYPSLKINVNSHTDSQGRDSYNLWLSQKRAESTVAYMISKGIASSRLIGKGYGETKLVNKCNNGIKCSKNEHQLNRRSEFIISE